MGDFAASFSNVALPPSWRLIALDEIDSTNEEARRHVLDGDMGPLAIIAGLQVAGRGRRGRSWVSPPGNLYTTFLIGLQDGLAQAAQLSFAAGLALIDSANDFLPGKNARLKWPNDLLIENRKAAGILLEVESVTRGDETSHALIIGIGVNIATSPENLVSTPNSGYGTTDLQSHAKALLKPQDLLPDLLRHFDYWLMRWRAEGFAPLRQAWLAHAPGVGHPVTARLADGNVLEGHFLDLDQDGALLMLAENGAHHRITAGDVFFAESAA